MSTRDTWCRHRTSFSKEIKTCLIGVDFHQFDLANMPCLGETEAAKALCPKYQGWTDEELAAREKHITERLLRVGTIRQAIIHEADTKGLDGGRLSCPCCGTGTVKWSRARINGHVHAHCSTEGCASWME